MSPKVTFLQSTCLSEFLKFEPSIHSFLPKFHHYIFDFTLTCSEETIIFILKKPKPKQNNLGNTVFRPNAKLKIKQDNKKVLEHSCTFLLVSPIKPYKEFVYEVLSV